MFKKKSVLRLKKKINPINNISHISRPKKKIAIIYAYYERKNEQKNQTNLSFFIKYGLDKSRWKDMDITTLFIINGHQCEVLIPEREDIIVWKRDYNNEYDIGSYKLGIQYFEDKYKRKFYDIFDHLFIMNAGIFGPIYESDKNSHWLDPFFNKLKNEDSVICSPVINFLRDDDAGGPGPRCQSYCSLIKIDRYIYNLLLNTKISMLSEGTKNNTYQNRLGKVIDIHQDKVGIILFGEYGLTRILLNNNYKISCLIYDNINYFDKNIYDNFSHRIDRYDDFKEEYFEKCIFIKNNWFIDESTKDSLPVMYNKTKNYYLDKLKLKILETQNIIYDYDSLQISNIIDVMDHIKIDKNKNKPYSCLCNVNDKSLNNSDCPFPCSNKKRICLDKKEGFEIFGNSEEVI